MTAYKSEVTHHGLLDLQVCVPDYWTDAQALLFAELEAPCGTSMGWQIRKQGDKLLAGQNERVQCQSRDGFVHIMLDA